MCPNCRKVCYTRDIVPDFRLDEFLQALKEQEDNLTKHSTEKVSTTNNNCEHCVENEIAFYCKDCDQYICKPCKKIHSNTKATKNHEIENFSTENEALVAKLKQDTETLRSKILEYKHVIAECQTESDKTKAIQLSAFEESKRSRNQLHKEIDERFDAIDGEILSNTDNHILQLDKAKERYALKFQELDVKRQQLETKIKDDTRIHDEKNSIDVQELMESVGCPKMHFSSIALNIRRDTTVDISKAFTLIVKPGSFELTVSENFIF